MAELACSNGGVRVFAAGSTIADVPTMAIPPDDVVKEPGIIVKSRGYVGFDYYEQPFTHKSELWSYTSSSNDTDLKFVYYYLLTQCLSLQTLARSKSVKLPQLATGDTDRLEIPLPPLSVQKEIVRMLDDMAGLIDALEEELAARKKQYEWCRERLLRTDDAEIMSLGEICDYSTKRISASSLNTHTYICVESMLQNKCGKVDAASVPELGNLIAYEKGDVLIGNIRPYLKKIWLADVDGGTNGDVLVVQRKDKNLITSEYLYYVLSSDEFFLYDMQYAKGAKMPRGDKAAIMKYSIPVPPLNVQNKIVRILDDMTELIAALEEELAARKQQYEYYRDKLLAFKRKPEVA